MTAATFRPLPGHLQDRLREGVGPERHRQRAAVWHHACESYRLGRTRSDFLADMTDPRNRLAGWYFTDDDGGPRGPRAAVQKMHREWSRAGRAADEDPAVRDAAEVRQLLGLYRAAVPYLDWSGRSGLRDRTVYLAILDRATQDATLAPGVSVRAVTEATGYRAHMTISRAIHGLVTRGLLAIVGQDPGVPHILRVLRPAECASDTGLPPAGGSRDVSLAHSPSVPLALTHGSHSAAVLSALASAVPQRADDIAKRAGVSRRTAFTKLKALAADGLAVSTPDGWILTAASPEAVAILYGASELEQTRRTRHELQRRGYHSYRHPLPVPSAA